MEIHTVLTGKEFNALHVDKKFHKVLNDSRCHFGFTYTEGLNVDTQPFNPSSTCSKGGLYFCEEEHLHLYLFSYGSIYATVSIPEDALVYKEDTKYKANQLILHNIQPISELPLWLDATVTKKIVKKFGHAIKYTKEPSEEVQRLAVQQNGFVIKYIKEPSEEVRRLAVQENGHAIQYIKEPSEEVRRLAVQQNGDAIQYVKEPSEELRRLAVQENGYAIHYIKEPSEELRRLAVQRNGDAIEYIKEPSEEECRLAVQKNGNAIHYIKEPSEEVRRLAVQQDGDAYIV